MRKINAVISLALVALLLLHGIAGGFQMMGLMPGGDTRLEILAWLMIALLAVHLVIGAVLTAKTIAASRRAGVIYVRENALFWTRRLSGFALALLLIGHLLIFVQTGTGAFRLHDFGAPQLLWQLLLLVSLALHLLSNIRPLAVALGLHRGRGYGRDVVLILAVVMAFCAVAFAVYYLRWNVLWRVRS